MQLLAANLNKIASALLWGLLNVALKHSSKHRTYRRDSQGISECRNEASSVVWRQVARSCCGDVAPQAESGCFVLFVHRTLS